jgi:hypothetical protein
VTIDARYRSIGCLIAFSSGTLNIAGVIAPLVGSGVATDVLASDPRLST